MFPVSGGWTYIVQEGPAAPRMGSGTPGGSERMLCVGSSTYVVGIPRVKWRRCGKAMVDNGDFHG